MSPGNLEKIRKLETDVLNLLSDEEIYWKQRARADWLAAGDKNSKYFHARATARKKKNTISQLKDEESGTCYNTQEGIANLICKVFSQTFQSSNPSTQDIEAATANISSKLSSVSISALQQPFSIEEIKKVVFELGPTKAPGQDGFQPIFYQKFWSTIQREFTEVCLKVLNGHASIREFNNTDVVLTPKIRFPVSPKDLRPISLCSTIYKTIAKVLANRLKHVLPELISKFQSAFVPGRQIFDNVLTAFEIIHSISKRKKGKQGLMALKLDMSKAYDRVEWKFVKMVLRKMEFPQPWINLIMDCLTSTKLHFIINGKRTGSLVPTRGLRQGCPLSPYIFILCAEAFSRLISAAETDTNKLGISCCRGSPRVSHLFFADDSIIFSKASLESCDTLLNILKIYEMGSGQQINIHKSCISLSPNVSSNLKNEIQQKLGLASNSAHDKYLGLPTLIGRNKRRTFEVIKERVWKRMQSWRSTLFSAGGKEILIKAVAQAIPTYTMSLFKLPSSLCKELGSLFSRFWWGTKGDKRKISWRSWKDLCLPKDMGGLGFKDLSLFNQALLAKQAWKILTNPSSLAAMTLKAKYFRNSEFLNAKLRQGSSHVWQSLLWGRELLSYGLRKRIGDGDTTYAFRDPWLPRPTSFKPITAGGDTQAKVKDFIDFHSRNWDVGKISEAFLPIDRETILSIPLGINKYSDNWLWHYEKQGVYTVRSGYRTAVQRARPESTSDTSTLQRWWRVFWSLEIPPKIKIFAWKCQQNAIPTCVNLFEKKITVNWNCQVCEDEPETVLHALIWCIRAKEVWSLTPFDCLLQKEGIHSIQDLLRTVLQTSGKEGLNNFCVFLWSIWWNRNASLHEGHPKSAQDLVNWSTDYLKNFQEAKSALSPNSNLSKPHPQNTSSWFPPPANHLKLNTDVALKPEQLKAGLGAIIRDSKGWVIAALSKQSFGNFTAEIGELLALRQGLLLAKSLNLQVETAEVDASNVASRISSNVNLVDDASCLVSDIKLLCSELGHCKCSHIPRRGNEAAHFLANLALSSDQEKDCDKK